MVIVYLAPVAVEDLHGGVLFSVDVSVGATIVSRSADNRFQSWFGQHANSNSRRLRLDRCNLYRDGLLDSVRLPSHAQELADLP